MIEIAKILKPQGIKGEVKAQPLTNLLADFKNLKVCYIGDKKMIVKHISLRQDFLYITFDGIVSRNDAETLRNKYIKIEKSELSNFKNEDDFLIDDLLGMTLCDLDGNFFGQIVDIENYGSYDIFIIESENRRLQIPYVEGVFIKDGDKLIVDKEKAKEVAI